MAEFTPNYNLEKPAGAEKYYISKFNANADKIDEALKGHDDTIAANKTQEEQDISDLRNELQDYADNAVSEHNLSEDDNLHPHIQRQIAKALADAKDYTYSQETIEQMIVNHNNDESAHKKIRDMITNIGDQTSADITSAIEMHDRSEEAHQDIRIKYRDYTDNAVSTHNNDPEAHGGKDVVYTKLAALGNGFTSSMTHADILIAFQDGKNVVALLNSGGEVQLETDGANITGKRTVIEGDKMVLETYVLDPETNMFTKTSTKYLLDYAPAIADEAIADVSIIVDPESDDESAKIGSAIIGQSRIGGGTAMGGADWNAQEGEAGYIANKPFGEIGNGETVIWEGDSSVDSVSSDIYYPETPQFSIPLLQEGITYTATIGDDSVEFTVPIAVPVASKSKTFGVKESMSTAGGYAIKIALNPNVYTSDTVHLKITSSGATIKKIDPKFIENSFVIDVDLENMVVNTSASDIRNAVANKMPIYVHFYMDYVSIKNYSVQNLNGVNSIYIDFDVYDKPFEITCENNEVTIAQQKTITGFYKIVPNGSKLQFLRISDLSWMDNTTSIIYGDDIYTAVSKDANVYTYRNEKYGDKVNGVLPLTVSELKITVLDDSGAVVDTNYTIEYTSTIHGIQTVPLVTFMTYDGSSVIGTSTITNGTPDSIPTIPTRTITDCTVTALGWNTEKNSSSAITLENITDSFTVYAAYEVKMNDETINDNWSTIAASAKDGTYKTKYKVGDLKTVDLGSEGVHLMQLVAFDADDKADGSGKAPMTWIMRDLLPTRHRMNPSKVDGQEGTGSLGGYDKTEMKSYLTETILPLFPADIRNNIVPVTKHQKAFDASGTAFQESTTETLWIPGHKEIFNRTTYDTDGPAYSDVFKDATSRIKKKNGSADYWWLRSASNAAGFRYVYSSGIDYGYSAYVAFGVCPGFCF